MKNEASKQTFVHMGRCYVGNLLHLAVCGDSISTKLWLRRTGVYRRRGSDVDDAHVQRRLKYSLGAVRVTLRCHPKSSS